MAELAALAATVSTFFVENAAAIGTVASTIGTGVTAYGTIAAGKAEAEQAYRQGRARKEAAEFEASELERQAKEQAAAAQMEAGEYRRKKVLALSEVQANSAASGFMATDPSTLAIADEIAKYGTLQESMAQYGGDSRAAGLKSQAAASRFSGRSALAAGKAEASSIRRASTLNAAGTILGGVSTLADRFGRRQATAPQGASYRYGGSGDPSAWRTTVRYG